MPTMRFTQDTIDSLKPPPEGRAYFWDTSTPGFGIRISAKGKKTWVTQYRVRGKPQMETIGSTSDIPNVKEARKRAIKSRVKAHDGIDPLAEKRAEKLAKQKPDTLEEVADRYLREYCRRNLRPNSLRETARMFDHDVFPTWGKKPLIDITRKDVKRLLEHKASHRDRPRKDHNGGSGVMANRHLSKLKTFFGWCVKEELITINPALGIDKLVREVGRERILDHTEIAALWHACDEIAYPYGPLTKLLLLTGARRSEVAGMRWSELDLEKLQWTIPRDRSKNDKSHFVHLSPLALEIINSLPHSKDLLFSRDGRTPVSGFPQLTKKLNALMAQLLRRKLEHWTPHDLRRTAASGMSEIGIAPHLIDRVLNHQSGVISAVSAIYNRYQYQSERRDALNAWASHVEELVKVNLKRAVL